MEGRGSVRRAALEETRGEEGPHGGRRKRRGGEGKEGEGKEDRRREREGDGRCGRGRQTGDREKPNMKKNWHHRRVVI